MKLVNKYINMDQSKNKYTTTYLCIFIFVIYFNLFMHYRALNKTPQPIFFIES